MENTQEIVDRIRFFGSVVSTNGIHEDVKKTANAYLKALIESLEPSIRELIATEAGIIT